jgi:acyl-CoA thioesterase
VSELEEALKLKLTQPGSWRAFADPRYEASTGMFGGWTAAILLRAAIDDAARQGVPSAVTINYVDKVEPGTDVAVRARRVGGTRSLQHWHSEMLAGNDDRILAYAMLVFADRRATDGFTEPKMPHAAAPDTFELLHPPGAHGERTVYRPITGNPPFAQPSTASTCWVRDNTGRRVDYLQLALLADVNAPRSFYWSAGPRLSATMTMSVYFHGTKEEIDAVGDDYLFNETVGTRGDMSTSGQQTRLWRADGVLLATSEQLCWYR